MQLKLFQTLTVSPNSTNVIQVPAGRYSALFLRLTGTTDTGQTLSNADVGTIRFNRYGAQVVNATWDHLAKMSNLFGGFIEATFPTAGATATSIVVPFSVPGAGLPNTAFIASDTECNLYLDALSTLSTRFGANAISLSVYGIEEALVPETYQLVIAPANQTAGGAGSFVLQVPGRNTALLVAEDSSSVVTSIFLTVDGRVIVPNVSDAVLLAVTNALLGRVEVTGNTLVLLPTSDKQGDLSAFGNEVAEFTNVFSGSGSLLITSYQIQPSNPSAVAASVQNVQNAQSVRSNRLGIAPPPRPLGPPLTQRTNPRRVQ